MRGALIQREAQLDFVGFGVGSVEYAVPVTVVREVIAPSLLTALPHQPNSVAGVARHRGEIVPIIDLRKRFGLEGPLPEKARWLLVTIEGRPVGLAVDRVSGVFSVAESAVGPAPELGGGEEQRGLAGVIASGALLTFVLDLARLATLVRRIGELHAPSHEESA